MTITTIPLQEFAKNADAAAKAADKGPVFITRQGRAVQVLLNIADYQRLIREHRNMAELLAIPEMAAGTDFEPVRSSETVNPADFS
ncbi:MAG: type II toxin-antitoxin system Phd/YefM family antitoxin [Pseudomonadota bacterium]